MLSEILPDPRPDEPPLSRLDHLAVAEHAIVRDLVPAHRHATLVGQPAGLAEAGGDARLDEQLRDRGARAHLKLRHRVLVHLVAPEHAVELLLGRAGRLVTVEPADDL